MGLGPVRTAYGLAQGVPGETYGELTLFRGIPYAAPPVGRLRWAAPIQPEPWEGVRIFDTYGDAAMQWPGDMMTEPWKSDFYYEPLPKFSEDCLYLNIATPSVSGEERLPVYVWFHGGGLKHGFAYERECDPEGMARKGVVVVEVGTRLGVFGYLSLPQLDIECKSGISGNYAIKDEIRALDWIWENIAAFGGDRTRITVGGQSGGTAKTSALFANPHSAGMIRNVICESNLHFDRTYAAKEEMQEKSVAWLKMCGLTGEETLEELRAMDASVFMGNEEIYYMAPQQMLKDNETICCENLQEVYERGDLRGVNFLTGVNLGEFSEMGCPEITDAAGFYAYYKKMLGNEIYEKYHFEDRVRVTTPQEATDMYRVFKALIDLARKELFGPKYASLGCGNVFLYLFSHRAPGRNEDLLWAWHSSELWYVFDSLRDLPQQRSWTAWDHSLADICSSYWTNFMKTGDPNGEGLPGWHPARDGYGIMNLGNKNTIGMIDDMYGFGGMLHEYVLKNYPNLRM